MKKFDGSLPALLILLALLLSLLSCGGEPITPADEGEVISEAERLVGESAVWNSLFFREGGMPYLDGGRTKGVYREVDGKRMEEMGFHRLSDVKKTERELYSPSMCAGLDRALFAGYVDSDVAGVGWSAALVEDTKVEYDETGESRTVFVCFLANPNELPMIPGDEVEYDFSSAVVTSNLGTRVAISVPVRGIGASAGKTAEKIINLIKVDGAWYLDNYPIVRFPAEGIDGN